MIIIHSLEKRHTINRQYSFKSVSHRPLLPLSDYNELHFAFSFQLRTPSCQPSSTTPTAPRSTSSCRPLTSYTWPAATSCRPPTGPTCPPLRERIKSSPSSTRWWAWWKESSRLVTLSSFIERNIMSHFSLGFTVLCSWRSCRFSPPSCVCWNKGMLCLYIFTLTYYSQ